ncbi:putative signaling protein [Abditibacteriota bacterium]|nr:putative signaling protein [Abditibacteriota bacterium]
MALNLDPSSHLDAPTPVSARAEDALGTPRMVAPDVDAASTERLRAIADSSFDLICELNSEGRFTYQSPTFAATTGTELSASALVFDFVPLEDRPRLIAEYTAALAGTRIGRTEHRLHCVDGDQRWFESALRGIGTAANRRVVMVSREITARQRHQLELESLISLSKTVHLQSDFPSIARVAWEQMRPLLPVAALLLAWKNGGEGLQLAGETLAGPLSTTISLDSHPNCPLWSVLKNRAPILDNAWSGDMCGFEFPVRSFVAVPLSGDGGASGSDAIGALLFASERPFVWTEEHQRVCLMVAEQTSVAVRGMKMLDSTRAAETRYRSLVNDVNAIVWEVDALAQGPTFVSQQAGSWLGYSAEELRDHPKTWLRVIHPDERRRILEEIRTHKSDHTPWQLEFQAYTANRKEMWLQVLITPEIQDGKVVRARGLTLDVTQLYLHVDALLQTNAILEATQEASADGICLVDDRGQVVSHNRRFAQMWHIPSALIEESRDGRQLTAWVLSLMRSPDEFIEKMNLLREHPESSSHDEITLRDERIFERTSAPAMGTDGRFFGRVWTFSDITDRKRYEAQLAHRAFHDPLTDLPNRTLFLNRVEHALSRLDRRGKAIAVLFFDLDRFKTINDTMGHERGDWLLQEIASRLRDSLRPGDTAARFGGDEFTLLLEDLNGLDDAKAVTERLIESITAPMHFEGREMDVTASIGMAISYSKHDRASDLLRNADIAMYRAKNKGKARYEVFDTQMSAQALERLQLEIELRQAVKWNQLRLAFQPLVDLAHDKVIGVEALVRWQHPERGLIAPSDFIPIAEESGMILPIGAWVLREACRQAKKWEIQFPDTPLKMSVNLSARQFQGGDIVREVRQVLEETELDAGNLELEITETAVMEDADETIKTLEELKKLGVRLAIDDFGTGYSSLAYLERFPLDALKIDRSFVAQIGKPTPKGVTRIGERSVIMQAVQTLGQGLNIPITAEGIETAEQLNQLREMGCAVGQGFLFARPLDATALSNLLREKASPVAQAA